MRSLESHGDRAPPVEGRHDAALPVEVRLLAGHKGVTSHMAGVVLRVRLISGDQLDVAYDEPGAASQDEVVEHVVATLADDAGVLRCRHGDRLMLLCSRGVAAVEVGPRGAVL